MDYAKRHFRRSLSANLMAGMVNVSTSHLVRHRLTDLAGIVILDLIA
ncbi:hypothetical protein P8935_05090 [Telmatobacter sp. DSM 110680]|uniref:Uncharacterized protein n=1 Tax=Telmatobacter sp. DSM 110680 TaxID=3036704 RepID=A0AAU7DN12_9BACT